MVYSGKSDVKVLILVPRSLYPPLPLPGYKTHQVGKWNAGSLLYGQVPTERGFDSSLGYMSGEEDHYTQVGGYGSVAANYMPAELLVGPGYSHNDEDRAGNRSGSSSRSNGDLKGDLVDLLENGVPALGKNGNYAAYMYTNRTVDIIEAHDPSTPLFVYHAWQEAHTPNEVPDWELSPLSAEGGATRILASKEAPTSLSCRAASRARFASSRKDRRASHLVSSCAA